MTELTIGSDVLCDIVIGDMHVSRIHARMTIENGMYMYHDISANGTVINGTIIRNSGVYVSVGDSIVVAPGLKLSWTQVQSLMPLQVAQGPVNPVVPPVVPPVGPAGYGAQVGGKGVAAEPKNLNSWSWGGFLFGWLWAVCNGIYWPLVVLIPIVGWLSAIVINIILGIKGNRWAWENRTWMDAAHFERAQHQWAVAGLVIFITLAAIIGLIVAGVFAASNYW
ncbi:MAG: FHA domain-containing protein [Rikenellaceae bacterium]